MKRRTVYQEIDYKMRQDKGKDSKERKISSWRRDNKAKKCSRNILPILEMR